jgi:putative flippase GtrA
MTINARSALARNDWRALAGHETLLRFLRFVLVGGTSSLLYAGLAAAFVRSSDMPHASAVAAYFVLVPPTFMAHRTLVFRSRRPAIGEFSRYLAVQMVGICIASAFVPRLATGGLAWNFAVYLANAAAAATVSFVLASRVVFGRRRAASNGGPIASRSRP